MKAVLGVDLNEQPEDLVDHAVPWAARMSMSIDLRYVSAWPWSADEVFPTRYRAVIEEWEAGVRDETARLEALLQRIPEPMRGTSAVLRGAAQPALVEATRGFDLAIVASHGRRGLVHAYLGSVAEYVVRRAGCSVLVLRSGAPLLPLDRKLDTIVPIDAADPSLDALTTARTWLGDAFAPHLFCAATIRAEGARYAIDSAEETLRRLAAEAGLPSSTPISVQLREADNAGADAATLQALREKIAWSAATATQKG